MLALALTMLLPTLAAAPSTGAVAGKVTLLSGGSAKSNHSGAVVYLESVPAPARSPAQTRRIRQQDLTFEPGLTVLQVGDSIEFANEDKVFHNVFSMSQAARFDLGLYKSGSSKTMIFARAGTVDVYCNIHPQMVAKVKVLDTPFFAVTAADGSFRIEGLPAGTYPVVAWQPHGPEVRTEVTVSANKTVTVQLELAEGSKPKWHLRKDGTPYGRYR